MLDGTTNITFRSKGVSPKAIENAALLRYPSLSIENAIFKLYEDIYKGESIMIDLCDGAPMFKFNKDFSISSYDTFMRTVSRA
jgi:hypothetical protein